MSGDKAKSVMLASKLPVDALGKIWALSDIDMDGKLDVDEFAVVSDYYRECCHDVLLRILCVNIVTILAII